MPLYLHLLEGGPAFCRPQVPHTRTSLASHRVTCGLQLLYGDSRRQAGLLTAPENWQVMQWRSVQKGPPWSLQLSGNHHTAPWVAEDFTPRVTGPWRCPPRDRTSTSRLSMCRTGGTAGCPNPMVPTMSQTPMAASAMAKWGDLTELVGRGKSPSLASGWVGTCQGLLSVA